MKRLFDYILPAFVLGSIVAVSTLAHAQTQVQPAATQSAEANPARWIVTCSNQANAIVLACAMSQSIIQAQTRQRILSANILRDDAGALFMSLQLPHGLDLTKGVSIAVDDKEPNRHPIRTADANGAYARISLGDDMLQAMNAGDKLIIGVSAANGTDINMQLSLSGFTNAIILMAK